MDVHPEPHTAAVLHSWNPYEKPAVHLSKQRCSGFLRYRAGQLADCPGRWEVQEVSALGLHAEQVWNVEAFPPPELLGGVAVLGQVVSSRSMAVGGGEG